MRPIFSPSLAKYIYFSIRRPKGCGSNRSSGCHPKEPHEFIVHVHPPPLPALSGLPGNANPYFTRDFFLRFDRFRSASQGHWPKSFSLLSLLIFLVLNCR
ncbi:hypothetical protein CEXT_251411 [Caerostris extrusa]|uniref:Uncharacterized protein n=1 Tax=Caerostris extrusa TaxID=172846 RepID=A0AAV4NEP4_CAEEX|nr:hypothetical protein CEXT_251411 [Caerostris extrusa]